jgi:signal peptidase
LLAAGWLAISLGMAACALLPRLAGWHPAVVVSGSMRPAIDVGDVILTDTGSGQVHAGQVVLVRRPAHPGQLLTHRVVRVLPDGSLVTRGDANAVQDPAPVPRSDLLGVVRLVLPGLGRPAMLARRHDAGDLLWTALLAVAALLVALPPGQQGQQGQQGPAASRSPALSRAIPAIQRSWSSALRRT